MNSRKLTWLLRGILIAIILLFVAVPVSYWWSNIPPGRPALVALEAVWVWGPRNPLPGPKFGKWIKCWSKNQGEKARCSVWDKSGRKLFEGDFIPYKQPIQSGIDILEIDPLLTDSIGITIRDAPVSVVCLKDGEILIPEEGYSELVEYFDGMKRTTDSDEETSKKSDRGPAGDGPAEVTGP